MFAGSQYQMFAEYNRWMNEKLYAAAARVSDEQRKQDLGAYFKSIHLTFEHLLWVDGIWLKRFRGEPISPPAKQTDYLHAAFDELSRARAARDTDILAWVATLTPEWLRAPYTFKSVMYGRDFTLPGFAVVSQFFNHQTHHRGQVTTLLMQLGVDPGVTDIVLLPALSA